MRRSQIGAMLSIVWIYELASGTCPPRFFCIASTGLALCAVTPQVDGEGNQDLTCALSVLSEISSLENADQGERHCDVKFRHFERPISAPLFAATIKWPALDGGQAAVRMT